VRLRAVAVVRLIRALALGHLGPLDAKAGSRPARRKYTGAHRCRTKGLTTESASRPRLGRAVWKSPVLYSGPLHPPANPRRAVGSAPDSLPPRLSTIVERSCGYVWQ
jgi:hypothetical protein